MNPLGRSRVLWIALLLCPLAHAAPARAAKGGASVALVWPAPPDTARIRWAGELKRGSGNERGGFFGALRRLLTGGPSTADLRLVRPTDVYAEDSSRVYVTDAAQSRVFVFERDRNTLRSLPIEGAGAPSKPMGITGDGRGLLYLSDPAGRRVVVVDRAGRFVRALGGRGVLVNPVDVAVDTSGHLVWVVDSWLHQVLAFDEQGSVVRTLGLRHGDARSKSVEGEAVGGAAQRSLDDVHRSQGGSRDVRENRGGGPGEFLYPCGAAVSAGGELFVCDGLNARVQVFGRDGAFRRSFGQLGDTPGSFARPKGIALDPHGNVFVVDAAFNNVQVFDPDGRLLLAFGQFGSGPGQLWLPMGLWIDRAGHIYVADRYNARVETFAIVEERASARAR